MVFWLPRNWYERSEYFLLPKAWLQVHLEKAFEEDLCCMLEAVVETSSRLGLKFN